LTIYTYYESSKPLRWTQKDKKNEVLLYFGDIKNNFPSVKESDKEVKGKEFFDEELQKYLDKDNMLKALATQIVILSPHLETRFRVMNYSYVLIGVSILLMAVSTLRKFLFN